MPHNDDTSLESYCFDLPDELIAQVPAEPRDSSRLLVVDKGRGVRCEAAFSDLADFLPEGALLVANNSKVLPARLLTRKPTGGTLEFLLLTPLPLLQARESGGWLEAQAQGLLRASKKPRSGETFAFAPDLGVTVVERGEFGLSRVILNWQGNLAEIFERIGHIPLPPYIRRPTVKAAPAGAQGGDSPASGTGLISDSAGPGSSARSGPHPVDTSGLPGDGHSPECASEDPPVSPVDDRVRYQTLHARDDRQGSVAAPTAGLHFTPQVREALAARGFGWAEVSLYVGYGTFSPVRAADIRDHRMHAEFVEVPEATAQAVITAKAQGRPVFAVGTTSARALEGSVREAGKIAPFAGWTDIFIRPGHPFAVVDGMLTNFHLPGSSLVIMVAALAGKSIILDAYTHAVRERFRFFSYGDAMLIR
ncbi:S-adenosylmethionine:tRNA ribosyltransferase-isomerase [Fundidesulfovibrio putealis]|uniref:S-adenosylmethionine:tRNA ribosyltransferase-isomerase n=1 Tax=Fundidesulfovibrio putealis TaxID=270496 RepID=UPI0003F5C767|nr:S-adenosylmethionine:tRNA ribosyltransferase-isomerase [Fundidesulfovibrio putealis]